MLIMDVTNVFAKLSTRVNNIEVEDCAALSIEMENSVFIVFLYTHTCHNKNEMHLDYNNHHRHNDRRECWSHHRNNHLLNFEPEHHKFL